MHNDISRIRDRRPLQEEIREAILNDYILSGRVAPGDKLPSEHELTDTFRASRVTVRGALQSLRDQGYIRIARGSGSLVLPRPESIASGIDRLVSFDEFARAAGREITTTDIRIDQVGTDLEATRIFDAGPMTRVRRSKMVEGRNVGYIADYVPEHVMPFSEIESRFSDSVLDLLMETEGLVGYTDCTLVPVVHDDDIAEHIDRPADGALLLMNELTRSPAGKLVNRSDAWISPEFFRFHLRRRPAL
ncbi:MAG: GntR family transcriptional regulator [Mycobacteriaceae bacterium]|uniref:GntR family transcriptional regulator n=1 Tax=Corynebacterium sp. TaxID=1720 RepID=UPI003F986DD6